MKKISKGYLQIFSVSIILAVLASCQLVALMSNLQTEFVMNGDFYKKNAISNISTSSSASDYAYDWNRTWGDIYEETTHTDSSMAIDSSNNVYLVGRSDTTGTSNFDILFIKCNPQGIEQWVRTWDGGASDMGNSVLIDNSNEIYVVGMTTSYGDPNGDVVVIKYDSSGTQQWNFTWGRSGLDEARVIVKDSSNNYYIAGETRSFGESDGDAFLVKFDSNWIEQWNVTYGGSDRDYANAMEIDSLGNICIIGGSYSADPSSGEADVMILKYDSSGSLFWYRNWGGTWTQRGPGIAIDSNDNIYFVGHTFGHPASSMKGHLVKYDTNGNYQWERIWGVNGVYGNSWRGIIIDSNDEIFIAGCSSTHGPYTGAQDIILFNYDTSGTQHWYKTWGMPNNDISLSLQSDSYNNIYIAGVTESIGAGGNDLILVKFLNTLGPQITVNSPIPYDLYSTTAPSFNISINDPNFDFTWYSLDGGTTNFYSNETIGTISQSEWDKHGNGTVTISFFANNSFGNVGQSDVTVRKDILAPLITINSPSENQVCGVDAPSFDLTIIEHEVDSAWYTLDNGLVNVSFTGSTGIIDQTEWDKKGNGTVNITFYANNSWGIESYKDVMVRKDIIAPLISINNPIENEVFGKQAPDFNLTIIEPNIDSMWYTLDYGTTNITHTLFSGTIDQSEWNKIVNGTVDIRFYVLDIAGNEAYADVTVRKETSDPIIMVNAPLDDELFGFTAPFFNITVIDPDFDSMWYTLDDGAINITVTSFTGDISQIEWNKLSSGIVTIKFYANDTFGNRGFAEVSVEKDVTDPTVQINNPVNYGIYGYTAPSYDVSIVDINLDSVWYTIDDGITNISISELTGVIDQTEWDKLGDGNVYIRFYANDTQGNIGYLEILCVKDFFYGVGPVELISPITYSDIFSNVVEFSWYSLDAGFGSVNFTLQVSNRNDFSYINFQSVDIAETPVTTNFSAPLPITQGQYFWRVRFTYENYIGSWSDYFSFTLFINNYAPNLVLDECTPTIGTRLTIFKFTAIYYDLDNNQPSFIRIILNGTSYSMEKLNPSDIDYTDGCVYQFLICLIPSEYAYTFSFECSDGGFYDSTSVFNGPLVELEKPPDGEQGLDNLNSTNAMIMGISVVTGLGIVIPIVVITETKLKKHKVKSKQHSKIKK